MPLVSVTVSANAALQLDAAALPCAPEASSLRPATVAQLHGLGARQERRISGSNRWSRSAAMAATRSAMRSVPARPHGHPTTRRCGRTHVIFPPECPRDRTRTWERARDPARRRTAPASGRPSAELRPPGHPVRAMQTRAGLRLGPRPGSHQRAADAAHQPSAPEGSRIDDEQSGCWFPGAYEPPGASRV